MYNQQVARVLICAKSTKILGLGDFLKQFFYKVYLKKILNSTSLYMHGSNAYFSDTKKYN